MQLYKVQTQCQLSVGVPLDMVEKHVVSLKLIPCTANADAMDPANIDAL